jgi:hypothetical protein
MASCENGNKDYFLACANHAVLSVNFALIRVNGIVCESLSHCYSYMENCEELGRVLALLYLRAVVCA